MNPPLNPLLEDPEAFPPLPDIGQAIETAVDNPESSFEDIARVVESDAELSGRILALANSRFYDYPIKVTTVPDALSVIGLRNVRNLSVLLCLPKQFPESPGFPVNHKAFWKYSIAVGLCTRLMALECREANTERHFIAGFLHKLGRPLIGQLIPEKGKKIYKSTQKRDTLYTSAAQQQLGIDDSAIGAEALQLWHFPENISTLVRYHNKPVLARNFVRGVSLVHIASFLVSALQIGDSGDRFVPEFSEAAWGYARFEESKIANVVEDLLRQLDSVCSVFLEHP
ncbi:HDOD domain-containing protein [Pelagicoccus mobilis]|uniref:HDOD domain-containing protein n=1 Tax=Pelagicoccus mobilis TaxID=415221 RepID=A0A934VQ57_9BACT|nr:HDOD domain-containing protein [Pelagicoccus mobilis]MBK1876545.1 HDOD domain-containing protein [Pelagicoccus mobilis]